MVAGWPGKWVLPLVTWLVMTVGNEIDECPNGWIEKDESCYNFVLQPKLTFQEAELACRKDHSNLVSINSEEENTFVANWLLKHDGARQQWFTSGVRKGGKFIWSSDYSEISETYFPSDDVKNEKKEMDTIEYRQIVFKFEELSNEYAWNWGRIMHPLAYICEILRKDIWTLYKQKRDFSFGGETDPLQWAVAPKIVEQSKHTVFFRRSSGVVTSLDLKCIAEGNPQPSYRWFRKYPGWQREEIPSNAHYTLTNGRLYIQKPDVSKDVGTYYCEVTNKHGTAISNPIRISYGTLDEFSPVRMSHYNATLYQGTELNCQPPPHKPYATFNWYKTDVTNFIRPNLNKQMFLSRNGRLYISEVAASDHGDYFCVVTLAARLGEKLASGQPLTRNSLAITLNVEGDSANTYGPDIHEKFPQVFPSVPRIGQRMVLECLAYGRLPLQYNWKREDAHMNPKAYMGDSNRVLIIENALLRDTGVYTCIVEGYRSTRNKTISVKLSGEPTFPEPLQNQFLDIDSSFKWSCLAQAVPVPVYTWFRNGKLLEGNDAELGLTVSGRHLTFESISEKHNGVYECEATNSLGTQRSSAQLTAVSLKPTFDQNPVVSALHVTVGGSITIKCTPEAAPRAVIEWRKKDGAIGGNMKILVDGSLEMKELSSGDSGTYVCHATNSLGSDESEVVITVSDQTVLTEQPVSQTIAVNESTTLKCKASYDESKSDVIYTWKFFDHVIDYDIDVAYTRSPDKSSGALYLISAQFEHEGWYTCVASTVTDSVSVRAHLTVTGPPVEPGGVHKHADGPDTHSSVELWWMAGMKPGNAYSAVIPITTFAVEVKSVYEDKWILVEEVSEESTKIEMDKYVDWRGMVVDHGLSPGTAYQFRVRAGNEIGFGPPSIASPAIKMDDAAPIYAPDKVGGGGGKTRELSIRWEPLPRSKWGANKIWYRVFYRQKGGDSIDGVWRRSANLTKSEFHVVVEAEFFYTLYEVKVQAINLHGPGPNSTIAEVYSAEKMPSFIPKFTSAEAINSTAGTIFWDRIPNTRDVVSGSIFAIQVNYWEEDTKCEGKYEENALFIRIYGDVTSVNLIGMSPGADMCVNLQLLNHAGLSPKSSNFYLSLNDPAPAKWPEYVTVSSHGPQSVRVVWRGVVNKFGEATLEGYRAWFWKLQEDIRSARVVDFGRSITGVITGIDKNEIYRLRIIAYNNGGDGKKSPDVMFSLGGTVSYNVQNTDIMNSSPRLFVSTSTFLLCFILSLIFYKSHLIVS